MKVATTIQLTSEEDQEIARLKKAMKLNSKKAVVIEGLHALRKLIEAQKRRDRIQKAVLAVREESLAVNREWAPHSTAVRFDED
jgi:hypothetical protein